MTNELTKFPANYSLHYMPFKCQRVSQTVRRQRSNEGGWIRSAYLAWLRACVLNGIVSYAISGHAAEFAVSAPNEHHITTINIAGVFQKGDEEKFRIALTRVLPLLGIVVLESPGGNLQAGLKIGREISARSYSTVVKAGTTCASACALAWLAGDRRYMAPGAKIGFHAAYAEEGTSLVEKGAANALVGAYLNTLKLPDTAITYVTHASPREIEWLSVDAAMLVGINFFIAGENGE
jgi:membrane-bound ClpP family serine protease